MPDKKSRFSDQVMAATQSYQAGKARRAPLNVKPPARYKPATIPRALPHATRTRADLARSLAAQMGAALGKPPTGVYTKKMKK